VISPVPGGGALALNNHDQVLATFTDVGAQHLKLWDGARVVDLGLGGWASLNDLGQVVFSTGNPSINLVPKIYRDGTITNLVFPQLANALFFGGTGGINTAGQILIAEEFNGSLGPAIEQAVLLTPNTPTITWPAPADIVYGTPLSSTQLNATANVPGTFVYAPAIGTVLNAGNGQKLSVTFTPTDAINYTIATGNVAINVVLATPVITWNAPVPITFGTALTATQLNATANVPGSFIYTPGAGIVLDTGIGQTLSVTFSPTDATNYTTAAKSVTINVTVRPPTDLNGDGVPDVVLQNDVTRQVGVLHMSGAQGDVILDEAGLVSTGLSGWSLVAVADSNKDGVADLVFQEDTTRRVAVVYLGGANRETPQSANWLLQTGVPGWRVAAMGDFNGDGIPDIVLQHDTTRQALIVYMGGAQGNNPLRLQWLAQTGFPGWTIVGAADLDQDGKLDVLWEEDSTRSLLVSYMGGDDGNVVLSARWLLSPGAAGWHTVGAADFDRNGVPDLVLQNDQTRQLVVLYLGGAQGSVIQASNWLLQNSAPGWRAVVR
jgi:hypothetical protein